MSHRHLLFLLSSQVVLVRKAIKLLLTQPFCRNLMRQSQVFVVQSNYLYASFTFGQLYRIR
jgi:hypothetical protein